MDSFRRSAARALWLAAACGAVLGGGLRADDSYFWKGGPCDPLVELRCRDAEASPLDVLKCLRVHMEEVSPSCHKVIKDFSLDEEGVPEKCRADVIEACSTVEPGEGRVMGCLHAKRKRLAPSCQIALKQAKKKKAQDS